MKSTRRGKLGIQSGTGRETLSADTVHDEQSIELESTVESKKLVISRQTKI